MGLGQSWDRREEGEKVVGVRRFGGESIFKTLLKPTSLGRNK